jgi:hypothetical protein
VGALQIRVPGIFIEDWKSVGFVDIPLFWVVGVMINKDMKRGWISKAGNCGSGG